ncbi:MAG: heme NO-binding domain-containing protein [Chitinophagales bacterium]
MKGVVFTEFLEMVEDKFGYETVDSIIVKSEVKSQGAYTSIGTYPSSEMFALVEQLSDEQNIPFSTLLNVFGNYLFHRFAKIYHPLGFEEMKSSFDLLESIEEHIHIQVQKLYAKSELPTFSTYRETENRLVMMYQSERAMGDLAVGLIEGCLKHFGETASIEKVNITEDGKKVKLTIEKY